MKKMISFFGMALLGGLMISNGSVRAMGSEAIDVLANQWITDHPDATNLVHDLAVAFNPEIASEVAKEIKKRVIVIHNVGNTIARVLLRYPQIPKDPEKTKIVTVKPGGKYLVKLPKAFLKLLPIGKQQMLGVAGMTIAQLGISVMIDAWGGPLKDIQVKAGDLIQIREPFSPIEEYIKVIKRVDWQKELSLYK